MTTAAQWIERLRLAPHPEGGDRAFSTAIYFLLQGQDFSALHRIKQDEVWHFYDGSGLTVHVIDEAGAYSTIRLGKDIDAGEEPLGVAPAGCLFGASVTDGRSWSLVGCTVAPGFDFADFEMPRRDELCRLYPQHRAIIERLTR